MMEDFLFWLNGIEEDDPLPFEIDYIYFCVNGKFIMFGGNEREEKLALNFEYFPLEAQYFYHKDFEDGNLYDILRHLVEKALQHNEIKNRFKGKKILLATYGEEPIYTISG